MKFIKNDVNVVNTPTWVRMNEDAQKEKLKSMFISENGGRFRRIGNYVEWVEHEDYEKETEKYVVKTPEEKIELIEVFSRFCKDNNLNKAAMYGTYNGSRNHHKGYKLIKIPD
jgi:hypothetical protein